MFCTRCGYRMDDGSTECPQCRNLILQPKPAGKSRAVAVLLAVVLGIFTWLYTYKVDAVKFWVNLIPVIGLLLTGVLGIYLGVHDSDVNLNMYVWVIIPGALIFGIWVLVVTLVAFIIALSRPESFYTNYPNG